ncbi:hypothetical protein PHYBLDRAFT_108868 [Phycomyces blakesleeanus NRRL 1555(-)]|uniref:Uncharacterized protein n=2 Tax=Phycomyces blakesleeanus TaxID=4837 RepID=A0A167PGR9_PHYB8|nr:hypothetical protein PHYBLDRAFT_108868 [Phycomyces blakesleeanus NRRL 1555(-)]OAD77884.1 hypothetical protein PHYBLDRAFT_108868 [Phycomyces blakesleeanus NRRL 1555(-)]|eukprot:XP_018295924.1 hypothetical protein PHYBLDRAFT_108868 [Phycomyces blakesleeanus NRRL 1555(-)]
MANNELWAQILGYFSIACWIVVFTPQIRENYKRKNTDGVSIQFLLFWIFGDIFNLIGGVLEHLMETMLLLALYYLLADCLLMGQVIYYRKRQGLLHRDEIVDTSESAPLLQSVSSSYKPTMSETTRRTVRIFFISSVVSMTLLLVGTGLFFFWPNAQDKIDFSKLHLVPQLLGWASAVLYCGSRIPQIMQNFRNESVDGLSLTMFVFSVCGNLTYCLSIFFRSLDRTFLLTNFPWLLGSGGTLFFDFTIFFQFYTYRNKKLLTDTK